MIIDDAHQFSPLEMKRLLQWAFPGKGSHRLRSIVLMAEPQMRRRYAEIARWLPPLAVIDKINMSPLTEKQTAAYLRHRIHMAGYAPQLPFSQNQIRRIYKLSSGLPGWINGEAYMALRRMKHHFQSSSIRRRWRAIFAWKYRSFRKWSLLKHWA